MGKELIYMGIAELTAKIESLSAEDYNMVIMLVNNYLKSQKTMD